MRTVWRWFVGLVLALASCERERVQTEWMGQARAQWMEEHYARR